jgi:hypothetical protein
VLGESIHFGGGQVATYAAAIVHLWHRRIRVRVHLRHDLRFDPQFGACVGTPTQENMPCLGASHANAAIESQDKSQVESQVITQGSNSGRSNRLRGGSRRFDPQKLAVVDASDACTIALSRRRWFNPTLRKSDVHLKIGRNRGMQQF